MRIDRHIYGSVAGYRTLARSDGLPDATVRTLEGLSVGAPASAAVLSALGTCPAYIVLPIGQQRAVARIGPGGRDDQGRPTLLQVTLAAGRAQWDGVLQGDVVSLIRRQDLWKWDGQPAVHAVEFSPGRSRDGRTSAATADKLLAIVSLLERNGSGGKPVLVREQDLSLEEFCLLERLLPPGARASQTLVYRAFGPGLRASLVCMAREAGGAAGNFFQPGQQVSLSPYAQALAQAGFKLGQIPEGFIRGYRGFGMRERASVPGSTRARRDLPDDFPQQVIVEKWPTGIIAGLMVACVLLLAVTLAWWLTSRLAGRKHAAAVAALRAEYEVELDKVKEQHKAEIAALEHLNTQAASGADRTIKDIQKQITDYEHDLKAKEQEIEAWRNKYINAVLADVKALSELRLPPLSDGQQRQIQDVCEQIARRVPDGDQRKEAEDLLKRMEARLAKEALASRLAVRVSKDTSEQSQDAPQTSPNPNAQPDEPKHPTNDADRLLDGLDGHIEDLERVVASRQNDNDKRLLLQLKNARNAYDEFRYMDERREQHEANVKDALRRARTELYKWRHQKVEDPYTLRAKDDVDATMALIVKVSK